MISIFFLVTKFVRCSNLLSCLSCKNLIYIYIILNVHLFLNKNLIIQAKVIFVEIVENVD